MKLYQRAMVAAMFALNALTAVTAKADVLNIPFSAALNENTGDPPCNIELALAYVSDLACHVEFPISVPVGRTIQQIKLFHSTDSSVMFPFLSAALYVRALTPENVAQKFAWISTDYVPDGTIDGHNLMTQVPTKGGVLYVDQFQVAPDTMYSVLILMQNAAAVEGIQVTYN